MLNVVGRIMETASWLVRCICFDAHGSHGWFREAMFGVYETVKEKDIAQVPFFKDLKFVDLPRHEIPYFPVRIAMYDGCPVSALPGVCALVFGY